MASNEYNYPTFDMAGESDTARMFAEDAPKASGRAPDLPLEDLETGATVRLRELWARNLVVVEFGSFT